MAAFEGSRRPITLSVLCQARPEESAELSWSSDTRTFRHPDFQTPGLSDMRTFRHAGKTRGWG